MISAQKRLILLFLILSITSGAALFHTFDDPCLIVKGFFFAISLIFIGVHDWLTHEIPNSFLLPILATGLIHCRPIPTLEGFFCVSLLFLLVSRATHGGIGGGDIKLMAAAGFVLGPFGVLGGALIGELLFLLFYSLPRRKFCEKKSYAMAPWLGTGCFLAYLFIPNGGITV